MSTLETIKHNMSVLANAHIDWSLDGGMIWLTGMLGIIFFALVGSAIRN